MLRALVVLTFSVRMFAQAQTPTITTILNAASLDPQICPGADAGIFGSNLGTAVSAVTVTIGGKPAYVSFASSTELLVQIPFEAAAGATTLTVAVNGIPSASFNITLSTYCPAFFTTAGIVEALSVSGAPVTFAAPAKPGDTLEVYATGLGPTSPATPTGLVSSGNKTASPTSLTIGGVPVPASSILFAGTVGPGLYQINFEVPPGVQGTQPIVATVGGVSSSNAAGLPLIGLSSVVNNASFAKPGTIAPGSIASIFANGLGGATTLEASGVFPATSSEGLQVSFNGTPAPLFHVIPPGATTTANPEGSSGQIDLEVPNNLPTTGMVNVQLTTSTTNYGNYTLNMVPASPGLYRFSDPKNGNQYAIVQFANSAWVVLPAIATTDIGLATCISGTPASVECGEPANIGDYLVIYLTGLGEALAVVNGSPTGPSLPSGQNPPANGSTLYETPTLPTVTVGGINAQVLFSGLVPGYAGEYQIDVQVPAGVASGDSVPVVVTMMGQSDTANISIQPSRVPPPNQ